MRILMVSPFYPFPVTAGYQVRINHILRGIAEWSEVTFIAPVTGEIAIPDDLPPSVRVLPVPIALSPLRKLRSLLSPKPYHVQLVAAPEINRLVQQQLNAQAYDLAYCHFIYSLQYIPANAHLPRILDQHNVDDVLWSQRARFGLPHRRLLSLINLWKTRAYERAHLQSIWAYVSVSELDRRLTEAYARPAVRHFFVAPNCMNPRAISPIDWSQRPPTRKIVLAFMGSLGTDFNAVAAQRLCFHIYPKIRATYPDIPFRLLIIGKNPSARLIAAASADPTITVTGCVEDVRPWLQQADIFVAPLTFGAGTKLKLIEAMLTGLPVVGTDVAIQGLDAEDGKHYLLANSDEEIVRKVGELITNPELRLAIAAGGLALAQARFDYQVVTKRLIDEIEFCLK